MPANVVMLDIGVLLDRLNSVILTSAPVNGPRCLVMDNHGYLVTLSYSDHIIVRFSLHNLTQIDEPPSPVFSDNPFTVAHYNGAYYVGFHNDILVVHSDNMTIIHNISSSSLEGSRDMIFLNDGQQMVATSGLQRSLIVLQPIGSPSSYNYELVGYLNVGCSYPHGLFRVNDALFYVTSFSDNAVYSLLEDRNGHRMD